MNLGKEIFSPLYYAIHNIHNELKRKKIVERARHTISVSVIPFLGSLAQ